MSAERTRRALQAIFIACSAWFAFSLADTTSKWLTDDYTVMQILAVNSFFGLVIAGVALLWRHGPHGFHTPHLKLHILRAVFVAITNFCVVSALTDLPLAEFYAFPFLSPILVSLLSRLILREYVGWRRTLALLAGFAGVLMIAGPQYDAYHTGFLYAAVIPFTVSFNALVVRRIGHEDPLMLYAVFPFLGVFLLSAPPAVMDFQPIQAADIIPFFLLPCFVLCGQIGFAQAYARAPEASLVAPFHYTQMVWGILIGFFLFGDVPGFATLGGAALIIAAGLYIIFRERRLQRLQNANDSPGLQS